MVTTENKDNWEALALVIKHGADCQKNGFTDIHAFVDFTLSTLCGLDKRIVAPNIKRA